MLYETPDLSPEDAQVLADLEALRSQLRFAVRAPRRWPGLLARALRARAIRGSNSIEGYHVSVEDAAAALRDEEPLNADDDTWQEILGYRDTLTFVQAQSANPAFRYDVSTLNAMHFMLLRHDLSKSPGQFRSGPIYVADDTTGEQMYEGAPADMVRGLVEELAEGLAREPGQRSVYVRAAMAHLNLVMIHPWRDGNGRMARALQTLVLARDGVLAPEFSSIEEWLGERSNTAAYYDVLADVGRGHWRPQGDAGAWVQFNLRAHHLQAQTVLRRATESEALWSSISAILLEQGLPERAATALFNAVVGSRVTRATYQADAEVESSATALRHIRELVRAGLLTAHGQTKGRYYTVGTGLRERRDAVRRDRPPLREPYSSIGPVGSRPPRLTSRP